MGNCWNGGRQLRIIKLKQTDVTVGLPSVPAHQLKPYLALPSPMARCLPGKSCHSLNIQEDGETAGFSNSRADPTYPRYIIL